MKLMKYFKKKTKDVLDEIMLEQLLEKASNIAKENEELKEAIKTLTPSEVEDKKQINYIG